MSQKSYDNSPTLYLIPTPIGNMDDITLRTIKALEQVEVIFSEDTRVTSQLLNHLNIKKKLISNHNFNEEKNVEKALEYLKNGYDVGLVSDRGTPIVSDPGYGIAKYIIENGYNVVALPGATALIPALIVSGLNASQFLFYGFLNNKQSKQKKELENLKTIPYTMIFYESPHRIDKTLELMLDILGNRNISISREISKKFEEIYRGDIKSIQEEIKDAKGEFVIVVEGCPKDEQEESTEDLIEQVEELLKQGLNKTEAIKQVAKENKINKNLLYNEFHKKEG